MTKRIEELVEIALKKELTNETRTELVKILFTNKQGDIYLSGLQLQDFDGDLFQSNQKVKKTLLQDFQVVGGDLWQSYQRVDCNLYQQRQRVKEDLEQDNQVVDGYAIIGDDEFAGIKEWKNDEWVITKEIDQYKDMSREELIEELKKVKGETND